MNKKLLYLIAFLAGIGLCWAVAVFLLGNTPSEEVATGPNADEEVPVSVTPISHASAVLSWEDTTVYVDPVGGGEAYTGRPSPDLILITHTHGDHLDAETLRMVMAEDISLIVSKAVMEALPEDLSARAQMMENGDGVMDNNLQVSAVPMYNIPESDDAYHVRGDGNGYVLEREGFRVYIAGDTSGIPEMRSLEGINMAFVPMNMPYTMEVDEAADAVLDFLPERVYPYHYRGQDGLHDVDRFKMLVEEETDAVNVVLLDWYPDLEN